MEITAIEITREGKVVEATKRGDAALGDNGYSVIVQGWGLSEDFARANLEVALRELDLLKTPEG